MDPSDPSPPNPNANEDEIAAENALKAFWGPGSPWPATVKDPYMPDDAPPVVLHNSHEAELFATAHNTTLSKMLELPSAMDVGRANEYFSFLLMSVGWFLLLTSLGGWWRVKRFERGLRSAQQASEAAARGEGDAATTTTTAGANGVNTSDLSPMSMAYYTTTFAQAWSGVRDIQRGFHGMRGRPIRGGGHTPLPQDEHELLDAQGFGLEPMAGDGERRGRGLWGI